MDGAEQATAWRCEACGAISNDPKAGHYKPGTTTRCTGVASWVLGDWRRRG